jgi:DNA replication and repair protein RecF
VRDDGTVIAATWEAAAARKRVTIDGETQGRLTDALGRWLAVAFLPGDLALVQGAASERRRWLDRLLSLGAPAYLEALLRYRAAVAQRNAALRRGEARAAAAFDLVLARHGAVVVRERLGWVGTAEAGWRAELDRLGEPLEVTMRYRGDVRLADPDAWGERLAEVRERELQRGQTQVGPHRDDLVLGLGGRALRDFGSTGQQRTAAIGLRLLEHATLAALCGTRPALLVDDVFAELDAGRQARLAERLNAMSTQLVVTAPRPEDLPDALEAPRWHVVDGTIRPA